MPRCTNCSRESPEGSLFCLNCGTRLGAAPQPQTPASAGGLSNTGLCAQCGTQNPAGMNFCRQCGGNLAQPPSTGPRPAAAGGMTACHNCGGQTPVGFAFCQQCGTKLAAAPPSAPPSAPPYGGPPAQAAGVIGGQIGGGLTSGEVVAPTLAATGQPVSGKPTDVEASVAWGTLISVNRDGTDGERFPMRGEFAVVGRSGADINFEDDTFLAPRHARLEHGDNGARVIPLDKMNGVYRRLASAEPIADGTMLLVGREVMRFELVSPEERDAAPLVRHGVHMFGSPPREPWGRLMQMLPNGGVRDVRFLNDHEIVIGREDGDMVFEDDAFLSRRHAAFRWQGGRCVVEDLASSNGTFVRLEGSRALKPGDHLRMGDQLFRYEPGM